MATGISRERRHAGKQAVEAVGVAEAHGQYEPGPEYVCHTLAWIGTDLVECLEQQGRQCRFGNPLDDSTVFCNCQARKYAAQQMHR